MKIVFDNNIPIYIQLVEQIKIDIIAGNLKPGERLPSVRDFALKNKVNPNTMQKALVELEQLLLVYTERTNGKYVTKDILLINKYKKEYADTVSQKYFSSMSTIGFSKEETIQYLSNMKGNK